MKKIFKTLAIITFMILALGTVGRMDYNAEQQHYNYINGL